MVASNLIEARRLAIEFALQYREGRITINATDTVRIAEVFETFLLRESKD